MMGPRQEAQGALFYEFSIEDHVPSDHMLRVIDQFVDLSGIRQHLAPYYSTTGRPSVDPELIIRMLLVGYAMGIRSERRLCEEVHLNLAYRWFCRLDLTDPVPDHSTFSKNRHGRFRDSDLLRHVFETVVARCIEEGLASGQRFAADASLIQADANRQNSSPQDDWEPATLDPTDAPRAVREYLDTLDDAAFGAASPVKPKFTSHSDPASQWTGARGGPAYFAYSANYLIDTDNAVILDVEATRSIRQAEIGAVRTMVDRVTDTFGLKPERLIADTAYGTGPMLNWLAEERGIAPHIPVVDKSSRKDGTFERADFTYDAANDAYVCPGGKELRQYRRAFSKPREAKPDQDGMLRYRARKSDCDACALKSGCCPKAPQRKVTRSIYEPSRDVARAIAQTTQYAISCKLRKKVEMLFAHLKRILGIDRLRLRGPCGARDEFHLAATAQNLRKLAKLLPQPQTPRSA
ncbi:IS1182 family transposase [Leisingera aquaemixtae]|uniref:IS1182 family transposase n=1 Tax=Leisingera aquaemixtae TaxID=1396826 RepID=UPI0021A68140|nr:IS1182 family transposase [Leisingera aquaemixtae]UWQ26677.1 IS1182 family transposase [Leisingera aquaemixtae]